MKGTDELKKGTILRVLGNVIIYMICGYLESREQREGDRRSQRVTHGPVLQGT
jgi:hypothetical protein